MKQYDEPAVAELSAEAVQRQVERILGSEKFSRSKRLRSLLLFTVNQTLQGNADTLKEYVIGTEVLNKPGSYDPRRDSLVRVLASRLRVKLREYYHDGGSEDPLVIEFPKGKYVPRFQRREQLQTEIEKKLRARNSYSFGRFVAAKFTEHALAESAGHFHEAIDADPAWSMPHVGLAMSLAVQAVFEYQRPREVWPQVRGEAEATLLLDEMSAEAHLCLGMAYAYFDWRWQDAQSHFQRAMERDSYSGSPHLWRALAYLAPTNRLAEAEDELNRAHQLAPAPFLEEGLVLIKYFLRQYDWVLEHTDRIADASPLPEWMGWLRGCALAGLGRYEESIEELLKLEPSARVLSSLGYSYGLAGQNEKSRQVASELRTRREQGKWVANYDLAIIETGMGNRPEALAMMQDAVREKEPWLAYLDVDPRLDPLHSAPRLVDIERKIFFPENGTEAAGTEQNPPADDEG